jgi:uncharacterized protein YgiM (DUF1202 family)
LETKVVGSATWGRIEKGWICLTGYVKLETVTENPGQQEPEKPSEPDTPNEPEVPNVPQVPVTKTYGTVTNDFLRIRKGAGTGYAEVGQLRKGDRVEILETKVVSGATWGRIDRGWICLTGYVKLETVTENPGQQEPEKPDVPEVPVVNKTYGTVTGTDGLNVRKTPNGAICGALKRGDRVEILETKVVNGKTWGRYEGGWFCITGYVTVETVGGTQQPEQEPQYKIGTVTAILLNVRAGAGTNYSVVCQLKEGAKVEILETKVVNGKTWVHIRQGWVSLTYIAM